MSDLWTTASTDVEAERLESSLTTARVAGAAVWPFLAQATTTTDYANRKALVADRIERIAAAATEGDPALFSAVHAGLLDGLDEDFTVLHTERTVAHMAALTASRAEQQRIATLREAIERDTVRKVLAGEVPPEFKEQQKSKGDGEDDSESSDSDERPEFITHKIEDDKKESSRRVANTSAVYCESCGAETGPGENTSETSWNCSLCGAKNTVTDDNEFPDDVGTYASRRTAGVYCNTHDVWVGDGNSDTHEGCSKEQKATEKTKDASRKVAERTPNEDKRYRELKYREQNGEITDAEAEELTRLEDADKPYSGTALHDSNRLASRRTAGENPFPPKDQGNDNTKPVEDDQTGTWVCPNCQATDAYTQGGKDLKEALDAGEPIKCGSCQQVDSSGGSASQQQAPAPTPGVPGAQATRKQAMSNEAEDAYDQGFEDGATGAEKRTDLGDAKEQAAYDKGYAEAQDLSPVQAAQALAARTAFRVLRSRLPFARRTAANPYADANPYATAPAQTGIADDLTDGPTTPVTTRPRQAPSGPTPPPPVAAPQAPSVTQGFASRSSLKKG